MSGLPRYRRRLLTVVVMTAGAAVLMWPAAATGGTAPASLYPHQLLAKAQPDECFAGVGKPYPPGPPCDQGRPKVNQAYVWGLTQVGTKVWFGTGANVNCLVTGGTLGETVPIVTPDYVCEFGRSQAAQQNPALPAGIGDHRPPDVYYYDTAAGRLVDRTADITAASAADATRLRQTLGMRAAGAFDGVVLFAGPAPAASINMFAFDGDSGQYLGSASLAGYGNIRHFVVADGALYAGVGVGANGDSGGRVLRWTGNRSSPFTFVNVGTLPTQAADLTVYDDRIAVATWSGTSADGPRPAGLWLSPPLNGGNPGLQPGDATGWTQLWNVTQYEPDPLVAATYGLGGLATYHGMLYWGTMHVPYKATTVFRDVYPRAYARNPVAATKNTQRTAVIFRGGGLGTDQQKVELSYGQSQLPAWDPDANRGLGGWVTRPTGYTPLYGDSGFGTRYNNYEWVMTVAAGKLFIGTMDWSYLARYLPLPQKDIDPSQYGADLWMFDCDTCAATAVDTTGVGNYLNYGIRNMIADGDTLYLGMANPMNLRTNPDDAVPEGGWELIRMDVG